MTARSPDEHVHLAVRAWRIDPRRAIVVGAACWLGFALMAWLVHSGRIDGFDAAGLRLFRRDGDLGLAGSPGWAEAVRDISALGGVVLRWLFTLAAVVALAFLRMKREAVLLTATVLSGLAVELGLKLLFGRPRPELVPHLTDATGMSFPSGHSFNSALGFIAVALAFATLSRREPVRITVIASSLALSMLVAVSRVALGVHYPSDVIAGWLGGAGWAFLAAGLFHQPASAFSETAPPAEIRPDALLPD